MARMGRSCRSGSGWIFGLLLLLISTSVGQNTTRAKEYQPEGCLRCIVFTWPCKCKAWFADEGMEASILSSSDVANLVCKQPKTLFFLALLLQSAKQWPVSWNDLTLSPDHVLIDANMFNPPKYADQIHLQNLSYVSNIWSKPHPKYFLCHTISNVLP